MGSSSRLVWEQDSEVPLERVWVEKRSEWSRFYLAEVSEADEISYNGHGVVDERRNLVEGVHAEIE